MRARAAVGMHIQDHDGVFDGYRGGFAALVEVGEVCGRAATGYFRSERLARNRLGDDYCASAFGV